MLEQVDDGRVVVEVVEEMKVAGVEHQVEGDAAKVWGELGIGAVLEVDVVLFEEQVSESASDVSDGFFVAYHSNMILLFTNYIYSKCDVFYLRRCRCGPVAGHWCWRNSRSTGDLKSPRDRSWCVVYANGIYNLFL